MPTSFLYLGNLFNQHQQLAEYLAHIAAVYLVYNKEKLFIRLICGLLTETIKNTVFQFKAFLDRLISHHKVLVRVVLVELDKLDSAVVFFAHHRPRQTPRGKSFSDSWARPAKLYSFCCEEH